MAIARGKREQRDVARLVVQSRLPTLWITAPVVGRARAEVTLVRIAPGTFDDDNLIASFKAIRDGVADAFGLKDNSPHIEFWYEQRRSKRGQYDVHIEIRMRKP